MFLGRDIFDIAAAVSETPDLLETLWNEGAVTMDELFEWTAAISRLNTSRYIEQIRLIAPQPEFSDIAEHAPEIVLKNIERMKQKSQQGWIHNH